MDRADLGNLVRLNQCGFAGLDLQRQCQAGKAFFKQHGKSHLMQDLAIGCIFGATSRKGCRDATKFGKLYSRPPGKRNWPPTCALLVWPMWGKIRIIGILIRLRVKNARCTKDIALKSAEL